MTNNNEIPQSAEITSAEPSMREIIFKYLRYWSWFVISLIVFLVAGFTYVRFSTPLYKIETDLLIKDNKGNLGGQNDLLKDLNLFSSDKIIDNEIQILKSNTIIGKTIKALNLKTSYYSTLGVRRHEIYSGVPFKIELLKEAEFLDYSVVYQVRILNGETVEINGKKYPLYKPISIDGKVILITPNKQIAYPANQLVEVKFNNADDLVDMYSQLINITPVSKQGTVLIITLESAVPDKGKAILNRLIYEYNQAAIEDKNKVTATTLAFINDRLAKLQDELSTSEKKVENYKSGNQITDISAQSQLFLQSVQETDASLSKVDIKLNLLNNIENYIKSSDPRNIDVSAVLGIEDSSLTAVITQLGDIQLKKQSLLQTVPETNPIIVSLNEQIATLKKAIILSIGNIKKGLLSTKRFLENKNKSYQSIISGVPGKERGLIDVMRQQEIKNNLFTYLLQKREETEISLASTEADSRTIDAAKSSRKPVKPVKQLTYLVFGILGLMFPAVIIYIRDILNFRISKRSDIENITRVPVIAEISHSTDSSPLVVVTRPRSMAAEQIRALRTNLNFIIPNPNQKVLLFTSSISGEGKSFISLNLGGSLALSGKKVVILELDLRKPKLHAGLEMQNIKGLSNYLIGEVAVDDIIQKIPQQDDYYIITCGPIPPNPAELLVNGRIEQLLADLKNRFDYIILDAPPVGLVTDAQILALHADATLYIVRHNYTAKADIKAIENLYSKRKFANLNIVMNSVDYKGSYGYGYGYSYGYGYGYGGYYQEESSRPKGIFRKILKK